jgi:hypothetical protein
MSSKQNIRIGCLGSGRLYQTVLSYLEQPNRVGTGLAPVRVPTAPVRVPTVLRIESQEGRISQ